MSNMFRAYAAVHNQEVKQHIAESRDGFSDINIGGMTSVDLQELAEEVLEYLFGEDLTVSEAFEVVSEMIESASEGDHSKLRVEKVTRIAEGFSAAFDKVNEKSPRIAVEAFLAYRRNKPLAEKWESRVTHEHGNERIHASIIAEERAHLLSAIKEAANGIMYPQGEKKRFTKDKTDSKVAAGRKAMADLKRDLRNKRDVKEESNIRKDWGSAYSAIYEKKLDPVGKEDADIDNDGDTDKTDKYLHKRRKAIGKAMGKCDKCGMKDCECDHSGDIEEGVGKNKKPSGYRPNLADVLGADRRNSKPLKLKKEEFELDESASKEELQKRASKGDKAAMKKLHALRAAGKIGKERGFEPGAKERYEEVQFSDAELESIQAKVDSMGLEENRRAARAAGGYVDDSKKQTDPSKDGFTGISGSIKDIMRQNKEIEARNKKKTQKEERSDTLKDRRAQFGGHAATTDYTRAPKQGNTDGKKKGGGDAFAKVKADMKKKYGEKSIINYEENQFSEDELKEIQAKVDSWED